MAGRECYHCKLWIEEGEPHDCWTTTEDALTQDLTDDLREAWERIRDAAVELGEQRIYASGKAIMFSRDTCYFFVRPKRSLLEVCVFLGRTIKAPQIRRADRTSKTKIAHIIPITHRDQVEAPLTDWLREAYELPDALKATSEAAPRVKPGTTARSAKKRAMGAGATRAGAKKRTTRAGTTTRSRATRSRSQTRRRAARPARTKKR